MPQPAQASTPSLVWSGASRVQILCLVQSTDGADTGAIERMLCDRVRQLAAAGASVPVSIVAMGDPSFVDPRAVTLLVHAAVQPAAGGRLLTLSIRPYRSSEPSEVLFGARPRAVGLPESGPADAALDPILQAALSEVLPWRQRAEDSRPINR
jgi:hypothetical protein